MSLRARLVLALVGLAAVGLLVLDVVSYTALRSYLSDRVDQQVESALFPVSGALFRKADDAEGLIPEAPGDPATRRGLPQEPPGGAEPPGGQLPPGTYGELRDGSGEVIARSRFSFGEATVPAPALPNDLAAGEFGDPPAPITVSSEGGPDFRVSAVRLPDSDGLVVVAVPLTEFDETLDRLLLIELIVTGGVLALLALAAFKVVGLGLAPLERMQRTARAIAGGDLSHRVETTDERTEVGRLGAAFNEMLNQIERAFAEREASERRLRKFLADASHELRTPLATIRGYSELFRTGAARDPAELEKAMRRIESESERVGLLVEDMLSLARLDEVRDRPHLPLDLSTVVSDAADDLRSGAPERQVSLELAPAIVAGDDAQLHQMVSNLLRNADRHTPPDTRIEVSLSVRGGHVELSVRDHGPGIPPGSEAEVFERFWRKGEGRGRDEGGAGLGLAIVAAIVAAHDGQVSAANADGGGALFTVRLPVAAL